eukprot:14622066-Heterocapsa_arctica.AAC.1
MWGVSEHESILEFLENAACYDYLDVLNLAGFEHACRRAQLIEYTYSERGPASSGPAAGGTGKGEVADK